MKMALMNGFRFRDISAIIRNARDFTRCRLIFWFRINTIMRKQISGVLDGIVNPDDDDSEVYPFLESYYSASILYSDFKAITFGCSSPSNSARFSNKFFAKAYFIYRKHITITGISDILIFICADNN